MERQPYTFYTQTPISAARALLGQRLVRITEDGQRLAGRIVEAEAYGGADDMPSHAYRGVTSRNRPMFGPPGHAYVYFIYGMYWMFNVVAHAEMPPGAVLIRALEPEEGVERMRQQRHGQPYGQLTNGPARLAQALAIDGTLNDVDLCTHPRLFIEPCAPLPDEAIACGPRVRPPGTDEEAKLRPWRFWICDNPFVSK
ncbi:MAG: DNA-3-methyladenine glycosylase [Anaerolineae bacterium]|nr:DNA-3-methyladenine glycosylase [Anaerolineae bacterium]